MNTSDHQGTGNLHCPYRQATLIQQALAPDKMRVAFFIGAGCPKAIKINENGETSPLIPDIAGLTKNVLGVMEQSDEYKDNFIKVLSRLKATDNENPNIEEILSYIRTLGEVVTGGAIDGLTQEILTSLDTEICSLISDVVSRKLPGDDTPYHHLASWIGGILRSNAAEVFSSNYDLLMEQALEAQKVPYFDGFVGSYRTFFDLVSMEQDNLPSRWARLWKVHGSINWSRTDTGEVERRHLSEVGARQMIYPTHLKYDESRRLPYLAMLDRLKAFFRNGQAVLITCGYSFSDQHLNEAILQGLDGNPTASCFGLIYGNKKDSPEGVQKARKHPNLSLLAVDGAVIGSIESDWDSKEQLTHPLHGIAIKSDEISHENGDTGKQCKFLLGDFKTFGEFLALQLSQSNWS